MPLPQFEADLQAAEADRKAYEALKPPETIVVRYGSMKLIGEFPYRGRAKPGCGSRVVVRTHRGVELGEMLTSTCPNSGCSKSVSRQDMLRYFENSGGRDYPFSTRGEVLRIATREDMDKQASIEQSKHGLKMAARREAEALGLPVKIVDAEPILGGQSITYYYSSEQRVDPSQLRKLADALQPDRRTRVDLRQVGARDEARLTADYERCGQYCCCKNFLKVLKPVSMKSAKTQKQTLDPLKISGRCGRLMCCLRYEDETYEELKRRLPRRRSRVGTPEGDGTVLDAQILTQLVLVQVDGQEKPIAVPVEELTEPGIAAVRPAVREERARERPAQEGEAVEGEQPRKKRRRRRKRKGGEGVGEAQGTKPEPPAEGEAEAAPRKKRRRRRRRRPPGEGGPPSDAGTS